MNYLAHTYFSIDDKEIMIGSFIADSVKGKQIDNYSIKVKQGIILHRTIDNFTDSHPIVKQSIKRLDGQFAKYGPVVIDMFYDHFLAANWENYHSANLKDYTKNIYSILFSNYLILPPKIKRILPFMSSQNWLYNYKSIEGIGKSLSGLATRTPHKSNMEFAYLILHEKYYYFYNDFKSLFSDLILFMEDNKYKNK